MNHKKSISILVVMSFLMTAFAVSVGSVRANPSDWNEGQVWGYKWQYNLADLKSDIEKQIGENATIEAFDLSGGYSEYAYVKYLGNTSEGYEFEFKGGSYEKMNYYIKGESKTSNDGGTSKIDGYVSADYSGTFWLTKNSESEGYYGSYNSYYGISKMKCTISLDMDMSSNYNADHSGSSYGGAYNKKGNVEYRNLELDFSPCIPMLPTNPEHLQSYNEINVTYSGDRNGHMTYKGEYTSPYENGTQTDSADQDLSKHISGSDNLYVSNYTMPILGLSSLGMLSASNGEFEDINTYSLAPSDMSMKYNNGFISSINQYVPLNGISSEPIASKPATEDEVNEYLQDKKGHTPGISNENGNDFLLIGAIIGIIAAVAVAALVLVMRRKKKMPPEMYGAYYQQTQDIQQIPENSQPPEGDYQEPPTF